MNADDLDGARFHVGSTIAGRYRVERPIGEGAMGAVALARHVALDQTVAIKFLRPELRRDPHANARLAREAKALARIKSDHVARVLDVGVTLSVGPYLVMEYLEGVDLGEVLETEGPLPLARAVECVLQVCEALTVAHGAGITHRDIKPQNLFLARHGRFEMLKILDFGIAEDGASGLGASPFGADPLGPASSREPLAADAEGPASSSPAPASGVAPRAPSRSTSPVYGTPSYMAPERVRNDPDVDHRCDIWSVGVVLHELVTGRAVFDADSITETCARIVSDEPIALEPNDAVLPPSLRAIIARCLERDPARRYQSVEELAAALAPLATMHERFRGRSTGAFSRRLEEDLAQRQGPASDHGAAPAAPGTWQHALAGLRAWGVGLWQSALPRQVGLGSASVMLAVVAVWLVGMRWMAPPPSAVPLHAERVTRAHEAGQRALVESVQPLAVSGHVAPSGNVPAPSTAEPASSVGPMMSSTGEAARLAEPASNRPFTAAPRASALSNTPASSPAAPRRETSGSVARASSARPRVRLVTAEHEARRSREQPPAKPRKKEPAKKSSNQPRAAPLQPSNTTASPER